MVESGDGKAGGAEPDGSTAVEEITAPEFVPTLKTLCIREVAKNFEKEQVLSEIAHKDQLKVVELLPLDLPLELAGTRCPPQGPADSAKQRTHIHNEEYWKRRSQARWRNCDVVGHGCSWKQLYFERNMKSTLEEFDPEVSDINDLKRLLSYSRRFVRSLHLDQLPSHLDLNLLLDFLGNSCSSLTLSYGMRNIGMDYDRSVFGMKLSDCRALARALERSETLTCLDLSNNLLDDDKVRMLASGLLDNLSVTHLVLAHNKIADRGIRALAKLLDAKSVVTILDLCDNHIHMEGGRSLARALRVNRSLISLNLRLNRLEDDGAQPILDVLKGNTTLQKLNLAANSLGQKSATSVRGLLADCQLRELDLSCNHMGEEAGGQLRQGLVDNSTLHTLDTSLTGISADDTFIIAEELRGRTEKQQRTKTLAGSYAAHIRAMPVC